MYTSDSLYSTLFKHNMDFDTQTSCLACSLFPGSCRFGSAFSIFLPCLSLLSLLVRHFRMEAQRGMRGNLCFDPWARQLPIFRADPESICLPSADHIINYYYLKRRFTFFISPVTQVIFQTLEWWPWHLKEGWSHKSNWVWLWFHFFVETSGLA